MGAHDQEVKFKVLWDDTHGLLHITCWGDYFEQDAKDLVSEVERVIGDKKNISIPTDLTGVKSSCRMARKIFRQTFDTSNTNKHAFIVPSIAIKTIVSFVMRDVTTKKRIEKELQEYTKGLENINRIMVGRELKMIELKQEIERLKKRIETL